MLYNNQYISDNEFIRTFDSDIDENELEWHEDEYDREVTVMNDSDWSFQFDEEIPQKLNKNKTICIKKGRFHRVLKGTTSLVIKIKEYGR
jgi:hypothetical protein